MKYDIIIIGAGPAGLMAANRASELGASVLLIEKNKQPGLKLLATGGGRCNITNYLEDYKFLATNYGKNSRFLLSAFSKFGPREVVEFFENLGIKTKIEKNNQVFPFSDKARDVLNALLVNIKKNKGEIKTEASVEKFILSKTEPKKIEKIILTGGEELSADNYILATGGRSYPLSGSTGDAYQWLKNMGHNIIKPRPGLAPIIIQEKFIKELEGLSMSNVTLTLKDNDKKINEVSGDIIFTANGLSGPASLNLSRHIYIANNNLELNIDFFPEIKNLELDKNLQTLFSEHGQKTLKNNLSTILPPKLIPVIIKLAQLGGEKKTNSLTKSERQLILALLKNLNLKIITIGGFDRAMITVGGLDIKEVDPKTMQSRIIPNLFIAGELLDIDGPTGGYNLQACWSTGYVAGDSCLLCSKELIYRD
jgi:predicted Rossmann fold flavoprotein